MSRTKQVTSNFSANSTTENSPRYSIPENSVSASKLTPDVGIAPVGTIVAFVGGYFGDGSNGSYTHVLGAGNTVAQINTYFTDNDINYRVCDGTAPNDSASPIWNTASRYLPNLTDDRFLMGDTAIGGSGGNTSTTLVEANLPSHSHSATITTDGAHSHGISDPGHSHYIMKNEVQSLSTTGNHIAATRTAGNDFSYGAESALTNNPPDIGFTSGSGSNVTVTSTGSGHSHTIVVSDALSATAFENRPQYLSVMYIIRIK